MNQFIKSLGSLLMFAFLLESCEKVENKIYYEGGNAPVLTGSTTNVALSVPNEPTEVLKLKWTNPDYVFTTGVSSQDVVYQLEIDTAGGNFSSKTKYVTSISKNLEKGFTGVEMNSILGNSMLLTFGRRYSLEARVTSTLSLNAVPLVSNKVSFTATPYAPPPVVELPAAGTLWATGNAFGSDWKNPLPAPWDVSQKFTKVSNTVYTLTVAMPGGGNYKLIQEQGVWGSQYHMIQGGTWESGSFRRRDAEPGFIGPPAAGTYKITMDFQFGTFTVVKQ